MRIFKKVLLGLAILGPSSNGMIGKDYDEGLAKLKTLLEAKPAPTTK